MPPVIQVIDALWHCLCPVFTKRPIVIPTKIRLLTQLAPGQCVEDSGSATDPTGRHTGTRRQRRLPQPPTRIKGDKLLQKRRSVVDDNARAIAPLKKKNKAETLREACKKGNYVQIHEIIRAEGDEGSRLPSIRLYRALILANTSAEHGSAKEITRWLEEMREEGIEPDSTIYHAALKVRNAPIRL